MKKYLMGIDNGGTQIKCVIFDLKGKEIASASRRVEMNIPSPGFTERDGDAVWKANAEAIREAIEVSRIPPDQIAAVGLTGYGNGICLVDKNGKPTYPLIVSTDSRAAKYCETFQKSGAERNIYPMTCQTVWSAQPAALLPWFRDNMPDVLDKSSYCLGIKDYVRFHLTGEFASEITEASSTCLCNLHTRRYDPEIFKILGIESCFLKMPRLVESTDITGRVTASAARQTGLTEGTPVSGGYFDIDAAAFASGILNEDTLCLIAGTWSINEYVTKKVNKDYDQNVNTTTLSYLPGYFIVEDSSPTSASNFDWFISRLIEPEMEKTSRLEIYKECDAMIESINPEDSDIVFIPFLFDSSCVSGAKAAFFNLSSHHTRKQMLLSVYEGVVFSTAFHVKRLNRPKESWKAARLSGGVVRSSVWMQMMADVLGIPIEVPENSELAAQGAAMGAGLAAGIFANHQDAVEKMVNTGKVYMPDKQRNDIYQSKFEVYLRALDALEVFHR